MNIIKLILKILKKRKNTQAENKIEEPQLESQAPLYSATQVQNTAGSKKKLKINIKNKKQLLTNFIMLIILGCLAFYIYGLFFPTVPVKKSAPPKPQTQTVKTDKKDVAALDPTQVNPFIEMNQLKFAQSENPVMQRNGAPLPAIPGSSHYPPSGSSIPLPAIPSMPNIPTGFAPPAAPPNSSYNGSRSAPATVQGILTGSDGNNTAIMSDGTVLSAGDTYGDGRVAYIGGDGVTFDNGNKLNYR